MHDLTDERLRTADLSQAMRERLCLSVLKLDNRFADVRPRRPRGGPDGGRDIEATLQGATVWGAIGFRSMVRDDAEDKRWVREKFRADLARALEEKPDLGGFLFFTNVDLTPAELSDLHGEAAALGLPFVDVMYRERLRIILDTPKGYAFRYQYLNVNLTDAEQAAFFAEYGSGLEELIANEVGEVKQKLARIEFLHSCLKPLRTIVGHFSLKSEIIAEEALGLKFVFQMIGQGDDRSRGIAFGTEFIPWSDHTDLLAHTVGWETEGPFHLFYNTKNSVTFPRTILSARIELEAMPPFRLLGDLDGHLLNVFVSSRLWPLIEQVDIMANGFHIIGESSEFIVPQVGVAPLPPDATVSGFGETGDWVSLLLKETIEDSPIPFTAWDTDFDGITPKRYDLWHAMRERRRKVRW